MQKCAQFFFSQSFFSSYVVHICIFFQDLECIYGTVCWFPSFKIIISKWLLSDFLFKAIFRHTLQWYSRALLCTNFNMHGDKMATPTQLQISRPPTHVAQNTACGDALQDMFCAVAEQNPSILHPNMDRTSCRSDLCTTCPVMFGLCGTLKISVCCVLVGFCMSSKELLRMSQVHCTSKLIMD